VPADSERAEAQRLAALDDAVYVLAAGAAFGLRPGVGGQLRRQGARARALLRARARRSLHPALLFLLLRFRHATPPPWLPSLAVWRASCESRRRADREGTAWRRTSRSPPRWRPSHVLALSARL